MNDREWLAERFEERRPRLRAVAYRMLGSLSDAEDAVQEAWLRVSGTAYGQIDDLGAWLTTVVGRISLNMLRSRKMRSETRMPDPIIDRADGPSPEHAVLLADTVALRWPWCSRPLRRPSASRSCCTTSSGCPSRRSRRSSSVPLMRLANWLVAHAAMSRTGKPLLMLAWKFNEVSSPPLLRLHETVTSSGSSRCSTRRSSSEPMPAHRQAVRPRSAARSRWPVAR